MADSPGKDVAPQPEGITDPGQIGAWLARQNQATQDWYLWQNPDLNSKNGGTQQIMNLMKAGIYKERQTAFRNGEVLEGVDPGGGGLGANKDETQTLLQSYQASKTGAAADNVSADQEDYTINPVMDQGYAPALHPEQDYAYRGSADPLTLATQDQAILQHRTDTTGVDAQKEVLGNYTEAINQGGLSAIDRARIAQSQQMRAIEGRGQEMAVMQQAEQQGRAGGAAQLLGRMRAGQSRMQARSMDDLQTNALALQRKDALMRDKASTGGAMQTAQDVIDQFNTKGEQDRARANVDTRNSATAATWEQNTKNKDADTAQYNAGVNSGNQYGALLGSHNTDVANNAEAYNKSAGGGRRGVDSAKLGAEGVRTGATENAVGTYQARSQQEQAAHDAAVAAWIQGGATILGGATSLGSSYIGKK